MSTGTTRTLLTMRVWATGEIGHHASLLNLSFGFDSRVAYHFLFDKECMVCYIGTYD